MGGLSRRLIVATIVCTLPAALFCESAFAENQWCGMMTNTGMTGIRGARVNIERYNPRVTYLVSAAWSMVANYDREGAYAQVGYCEIQGWGDHPYYFWEYATAGATTLARSG